MRHSTGTFVVITTSLLFVIACGSGNQNGSSSGGSGGSNPGPSGTGTSGGSGTSAIGGYAAGIGGAGQTSPAQFLFGVQLPGAVPIPTKINSDGTLTATKANGTPSSVGNPFGMVAAIDPSGTYLYEAVRPGLWGFTINRLSGDITQMANTPIATSHNFDAIAVDQLGKFVYAYGDGQVFGYTIQSGTGQLAAIAGTPVTAAPNGESFPLASSRLAVSQNNKFLYVATADGILGYNIDPSSGALTKIAGSPFNSAAGAAFSLVAPSTGYLYESLPSPTGTTTQEPIYGFSIDQTTGALTPVAGSPFAPGCSIANMTSPASGKFLLACDMYQIDASSGALVRIQNLGRGPGVFDPAGRFVWVNTTEPADCPGSCELGVAAYQVDTNTGTLTLVPNSFFSMVASPFGVLSALAITH